MGQGEPGLPGHLPAMPTDRGERTATPTTQREPEPMKALTVSQPFADLIAEGEKYVENRSWPTSHRGPLLIHAGRGTQYLTKADLDGYATGCLVARANLVACPAIDELRANPGRLYGRRTAREILEHEHTEGPYCWVLEDVEALEPIAARGQPGLWDWRQPAPEPIAEKPGPTMLLLPPAPTACAACGTKHEPAEPHNAQSMYYQYRFYGLRGRWPTWADAVAHCEPAIRAIWERELRERAAWTDHPEPIADPPAETIHQTTEIDQAKTRQP